MNMQLTALCLFLIASESCYSMHKTEEEMFKDNLLKLTEPIRQFTQDFATWPKKEQNKILLPSNSGGFNILIKGSIAAQNKYEGDIATWLENNFTTPHAEVTLFLVLDYLKKQKNTHRS